MDKEEVNRLRRKAESKFDSEYVSMSTIKGGKSIYIDGYVDGYKSHEQETTKVIEAEPEEFKVGDRVVVSAEAHGCGRDLAGRVIKVEEFLGSIIVTVKYDGISPAGRAGICLSNLGMLRKI